MYAFTLERPANLADATRLAAAGAKPLAGGQTLLASMKLRLSSPEQLADLSGIKELVGVCREGNAFVIGAMTRHADVATHAELKAALPALADLAAKPLEERHCLDLVEHHSSRRRSPDDPKAAARLGRFGPLHMRLDLGAVLEICQLWKTRAQQCGSPLQTHKPPELQLEIESAQTRGLQTPGKSV
jgi:hypothetical protein